MREKDELLQEYDDRKIDPKERAKRKLELEVMIDIRDVLSSIHNELYEIKNQLYSGIRTHQF